VEEYAGHKFNLTFPQPVDDHVVATDGRILVRVKATPKILATLPDISPKTFPGRTAKEIVGNRSLWEAEPTPLPSLDHLDRCKHCEGKGHRPEHRCSCDTWDDSEAPCHGKGVIPAGPCWECDGTGIWNAIRQSVDLREDVSLSAHYIHLLAKHGATLYLPVDTNTWEKVTPVYFAVGEAEGVLMPMQIPEPERKKKTGAAS
jgi:hypothetical protein